MRGSTRLVILLIVVAALAVAAVVLARGCGAPEESAEPAAEGEAADSGAEAAPAAPGAADPSAAGFETDPDPAIEAAILEMSPDYDREMVEMMDSPARYLYGRVDLDGDGRDEVLAYLLGPFFCGTGGCELMLFTPSAGGYALVSSFPLTRLPVVVSGEASNGWKNLVKLESGGGAPPSWVTYAYDGSRYVERSRAPGDGSPEGSRHLAGEFTFEDGIPLEPQN